MLRSPSRKARHLIASTDVDRVFDDACIDRLMQIAKFPAGGDKKTFAEGIRDAARIYVRDANEPATVNELTDEIEMLWHAANERQYDELASMLGALSERTRNELNERGRRRAPAILVPIPDAVRDAVQRDRACDIIVRICEIGGRDNGSSWQPLLYAPDRKPRFPKRKVERDFVMHLRLAWLHATGKPPTATVNPSRPNRPFANFVRDCLQLVGASHADHVGLINEISKRRRAMKRRRGQPMKRGLPWPY
jgi:hypothetical protein